MRRIIFAAVLCTAPFLTLLWALEWCAPTTAHGQDLPERPQRRTHPASAAVRVDAALEPPTGVPHACPIVVRVPHNSNDSGGYRWGSDTLVRDDLNHHEGHPDMVTSWDGRFYVAVEYDDLLRIDICASDDGGLNWYLFGHITSTAGICGTRRSRSPRLHATGSTSPTI